VDAASFDHFRQRLQDAGFSERDARYDDAAFGSWVITLEGEPLRVVWEGRDSWLIVQREQDEQWVDLWVARDAADQSPEVVTATLVRLKGHS